MQSKILFQKINIKLHSSSLYSINGFLLNNKILGILGSESKNIEFWNIKKCKLIYKTYVFPYSEDLNIINLNDNDNILICNCFDKKAFKLLHFSFKNKKIIKIYDNIYLNDFFIF